MCSSVHHSPISFLCPWLELLIYFTRPKLNAEDIPNCLLEGLYSVWCVSPCILQSVISGAA